MNLFRLHNDNTISKKTMTIAFLVLLIVDITYSLPVRITEADRDGYFYEDKIHSDKIPIRRRSIEDQELRKDVKVCVVELERMKKLGVNCHKEGKQAVDKKNSVKMQNQLSFSSKSGSKRISTESYINICKLFPDLFHLHDQSL